MNQHHALPENLPENLPELVVAARDWSVSGDKRRMVRAERSAGQRFIVYPPEPVGDPATLVQRLRETLSPQGTGVIGFDFPIGLPRAFAAKAGLANWRAALKAFGGPGWKRFYQRSDRPSLKQPFYPLPKGKGQKGHGRKQLADMLGLGGVGDLYRRCERGTDRSARAECLFFTLGATQVGAGAMIGWREVLAPNRDRIRFWPFDGDLRALIRAPGVIVAEVYPREACRHLGISIGPGTGLSKVRRADRRRVSEAVLEAFNHPGILISNAATSWFRWGFEKDDDFDAMMALLSMLLVITGRRDASVPAGDPAIRKMEGWILGRGD